MYNKATPRPAKAAKSAKPAPGDDRIVRGQLVVADEPCYSPLPPKNGQRLTLNMRVLTLADGTKLYECGTCYVDPDTEFVGTRGEVLKHRRDAHNFNMGGYTREKRAAKKAAQAAAERIDEKRRRKEHVREVVQVVTASTAARPPDPYGEDRADQKAEPPVLVETSADAPAAVPADKHTHGGPLTMPLCEVIDLVMSFPTWGDAVDAMTRDRDSWKKRAIDAEKLIANYERAFARLGFVPKEITDNGEVA